jgi:ABC-2 type transport system ATP-binding protein
LDQVITTSGLTKHYGRIRAVENLTFSIPEKSVFGILGPNGSGKTTTLGMLLDVINPTSGSYSWFNHPDGVPSPRRGGPHNELKRIGSILETPSFYPYLSAIDNLKIIAEIKGCGYEKIDDVLKTTGLFERRYSSFRTFSLGMKQRLALAAALLADPQVLILDEPTNGLDPKGIAEIRELIRDIARQGKTIILASHLLDEVQKVCTHFAVLNKGHLIHTGPVNETQFEQHLELAADDNTALCDVLKDFPGKISVDIHGDKVVIVIPGNVPVASLSRYTFEKGLSITHLVLQKKSLEAQFLEILNEQA